MPQPRGCKKQRALCAGAILATVAVGVLAASPAPAQTLTEAFAYAYNTNPQLLAQRALLRATDETVPQALSNWRPTVTVTGQAGYNRVGTEPDAGDQARNKSNQSIAAIHCAARRSFPEKLLVPGFARHEGSIHFARALELARLAHSGRNQRGHRRGDGVR